MGILVGSDNPEKETFFLFANKLYEVNGLRRVLKSVVPNYYRVSKLGQHPSTDRCVELKIELKNPSTFKVRIPWYGPAIPAVLTCRYRRITAVAVNLPKNNVHCGALHHPKR